jgi:hypothetical protein
VLTATPGYYPCLRRPPASARLAWAVRGGARSSVCQKRKGKNSLKALYTAPMSSTGGQKKRKEKKRKEKNEKRSRMKRQD